MIRDEDGRALAQYARASIATALGGPIADAPVFPGSEAIASTFVTLRRDGELHGCIGTVEPKRSLVDDVRSNAVSAALFDPRATPLGMDDVARLGVEVSLLSPMERIHFVDEATAIAALRPHRDGVLLRCAGRRATFLPQVWRTLPEAASFLASLKTKAGFGSKFWSNDVELYRYDVIKWADPARSLAGSPAN
jgi:AmmeMemoRadiSam system protein A